MVKLAAKHRRPDVVAPGRLVVPELVTQVSLERVVLVQGHRDVFGELTRNATCLVDLGELLKFSLWIGGELGDLGLPVCPFHVRLRAD